MAVWILLGFLSAAVMITYITWDGRNKSPRNLLARGMTVLLIGGTMGLFWSTALEESSSAGPLSGMFILIGFLGNLLAMYTAVLASALVRTAWAEGHTPVSEHKY